MTYSCSDVMMTNSCPDLASCSFEWDGRSHRDTADIDGYDFRVTHVEPLPQSLEQCRSAIDSVVANHGDELNEFMGDPRNSKC